MIYEEPPVRPFTLVAGGSDLNEQLGWQASNVIVDNYTNQYLFLPDAQRFVAPGQYGAVIPLPGVGRALASFTAPPGFVQPDSISGQQATLVFLSSGVLAHPTAGLTAQVSGAAPKKLGSPSFLAGPGFVSFPLPATAETIWISVDFYSRVSGLTADLLFADGSTFALFSNIVPTPIPGTGSGNATLVAPLFSAGPGTSLELSLTATGPVTLQVWALSWPLATYGATPSSLPLQVQLSGALAATLRNFTVGVAPATQLDSGFPRNAIRVRNPPGSTRSLFVGYLPATVAGAPVNGQNQGLELAPGAVESFGLSGSQRLYGVTAAGSVVVQVEEA